MKTISWFETRIRWFLLFLFFMICQLKALIRFAKFVVYPRLRPRIVCIGWQGKALPGSLFKYIQISMEKLKKTQFSSFTTAWPQKPQPLSTSRNSWCQVLPTSAENNFSFATRLVFSMHGTTKSVLQTKLIPDRPPFPVLQTAPLDQERKRALWRTPVSPPSRLSLVASWNIQVTKCIGGKVIEEYLSNETPKSLQRKTNLGNVSCSVDTQISIYLPTPHIGLVFTLQLFYKLKPYSNSLPFFTCQCKDVQFVAANETNTRFLPKQSSNFVSHIPLTTWRNHLNHNRQMRCIGQVAQAVRWLWPFQLF